MGTNKFSYNITDPAGNVLATMTRNIAVTNRCSVMGQVGLEGYLGSEKNGNGIREVVFTAKDCGGNTNIFSQTLNFVGGNANYCIEGVSSATTNISAKATSSLPRRLPVVFTNDVASANFTGNKILLAGDLNGDGVVDLADYNLLVSKWYSHDTVADIDGNGKVDLDDYFLLSNNWFKSGDSP